jgi:hypothetical protein
MGGYANSDAIWQATLFKEAQKKMALEFRSVVFFLAMNVCRMMVVHSILFILII